MESRPKLISFSFLFYLYLVKLFVCHVQKSESCVISTFVRPQKLSVFQPGLGTAGTCQDNFFHGWIFFRGEYFSRVNFFQRWIFFWGEYFSGVNIFQWWIFWYCEHELGGHRHGLHGHGGHRGECFTGVIIVQRFMFIAQFFHLSFAQWNVV